MLLVDTKKGRQSTFSLLKLVSIMIHYVIKCWFFVECLTKSFIFFITKKNNKIVGPCHQCIVSSFFYELWFSQLILRTVFNDNCPLDELSLETELRGPTPRCTTALDEWICFCAGGGGVLDIELLCF